MRTTTGIQKASEIIHEYYVDNLQHLEPFCNHDEWTVEMIEDHLCRHGAPEAVARGERPGEDMVSINLVFSLYYLFNTNTSLQQRRLRFLVALCTRNPKFWLTKKLDY